ncbi:MAG: LPS export ABC transporter periplasmic protein LptC [Prevotellaceae bacterium]|jgi:LPS export ABC transporter protein LptC|nr:LPS export ABC transporter periplasmic protein LptC [Prevotellaceae bacterium]
MIEIFHDIKLIKLVVALVCSAIIFSCKDDTLQKISSGDLIDQPKEEVINVKLISTSDGKLRNEMVAPKAVKYQNADTILYIFPRGIHIISYKDSIVESDLVADSATLNDSRGMFFTAIGNVVARNILTKKKLITDGPLFWDEKNKTIETKVYTEIYTETDTIFAKYGIFSDDRFKEVEMRGQSGVVFKEFRKE